MGESTASVKLTLNDRGFKGSFDRAARGVEQSAERTGKAMGASLSNGVKGGLDAVAALGGKIRGLATSIAGIAGGVGFAGLAKGAIDTQQRLQQLASRIQLGTGELVKWTDIQADVQAAALATGNSIADMTTAYDRMFSETGDPEAAAAALGNIGKVAHDTGAEIDSVARVAGVLKQKFAIGQSEMGLALQIVAAAAAQGGASFEDLGDDLGEIGGKAKSMGAQGTQGLQQMLGFLNLAKEEAGNFQQAMTALPQIFDQLIERSDKGIIKSSGRIPMQVAAVDKNGNQRPFPDIIADIIRETKGDAAALGEFGFGGEGLQTILGLAKDFEMAVKVSGGNVEQAKSLFAHELIQAAGGLQDLTTHEHKQATAADNVQKAMTMLEAAFLKPEMMAAMESLAESLPELAQAAAKAIDFIVKNPLAAGAAYVGGTFAMGAAGGIIKGAFETGGAGAAGAIGGALQSGGTSAASGIGAAMRQQVNTFNGAVVAFGAAVAAWGVAQDQLQKLLGELDTHDQDLADERENMLRNAEAQGDTFATRKKSSFEQGLLGGDDEEYIIRGADGKARAVSREEAVAQGIAGPQNGVIDAAGNSLNLDRVDFGLPGSLNIPGARSEGAPGDNGFNEIGQFVMPGLNDNSFGPALPGGGPPAAEGDSKAAAATKQLGQEIRASGDRTAQALSQVLQTRISNWNEMPKGHGPR